jgi:Response regulators consisting of a CheY-like receiver domain and a winged-helix DNA-binding domain
MTKLIYVTDDDMHIRNLILSFLKKDGFRAIGFEDGESLLQAMDTQMPDLIVLDIMLPGMDGLEALRIIRKKCTTPIILVSAKDTEIDRIMGITLGADDYLVKPFSPAELVVRVKAMLRRLDMNRAPQTEQQSLVFGDIVLDVSMRCVTVSGAALAVTPTEFDFLEYMLNHQERAISKSELLRELWHFDFDVDTRATDDLVKRLRKKLLAAESIVRIETVWGFGFRLSDSDGDGA